MVLEKIIIPEIQKVSGTIEKKICAVGITKILTECPAMMDTDYTKLWYEKQAQQVACWIVVTDVILNTVGL